MPCVFPCPPQDGVDCGAGCELACTIHWYKTPKYLPNQPVQLPMVFAGLGLLLLSTLTAFLLLKYVYPRYGL